MKLKAISAAFAFQILKVLEQYNRVLHNLNVTSPSARWAVTQSQWFHINKLKGDSFNSLAHHPLIINLSAKIRLLIFIQATHLNKQIVYWMTTAKAIFDVDHVHFHPRRPLEGNVYHSANLHLLTFRQFPWGGEEMCSSEGRKGNRQTHERTEEGPCFPSINIF